MPQEPPTTEIRSCHLGLAWGITRGGHRHTSSPPLPTRTSGPGTRQRTHPGDVRPRGGRKGSPGGRRRRPSVRRTGVPPANAGGAPPRGERTRAGDGGVSAADADAAAERARSGRLRSPEGVAQPKPAQWRSGQSRTALDGQPWLTALADGPGGRPQGDARECGGQPRAPARGARARVGMRERGGHPCDRARGACRTDVRRGAAHLDRAPAPQRRAAPHPPAPRTRGRIRALSAPRLGPEGARTGRGRAGPHAWRSSTPTAPTPLPQLAHLPSDRPEAPGPSVIHGPTTSGLQPHVITAR